MTGDTSLAALKPCPFCGESQAMLCDSPCGWNDSGKAWAVSCRTEDCHGAIFSLGYDLFETQAEAIAAWNTRTADQRCAELEAENARLREAGQAVIDTAFDHYTARNGRRMSIEGDDGEKCWIVPFDHFEALRKALENCDD